MQLGPWYTWLEESMFSMCFGCRQNSATRMLRSDLTRWCRINRESLIFQELYWMRKESEVNCQDLIRSWFNVNYLNLNCKSPYLFEDLRGIKGDLLPDFVDISLKSLDPLSILDPILREGYLNCKCRNSASLYPKNQ